MNREMDGRRERRTHYRVKYPFSERPRMVITRYDFEIVDLSEQGIRFSMGPALSERITFHDGESLDLEGKLLRTQDSEVVLHLSKVIPSERITKEQRYLMKKYASFR